MSSFIVSNTEAVALMQKGNNQAATVILLTALVGLKEDLNTSVLSSPSTFAIQSHPSLFPVSAAAELEEDIGFEMTCEAYTPSLESVFIPQCDLCKHAHWRDQNVFTFYPRAFILDETPQNRENTTRAAAVILYNLALIHHLRALQNNEENYVLAMLAYAGGLYKAAMDIACAGWDQDACLDMYCLLLALENNLGHIHGHSHLKISNFCRMRDCLNSLIKLVTFPQAPDYLSEDDFDFFYIGVVIFHDSPGLSLAPSA
jgi:hypothetical protein